MRRGVRTAAVLSDFGRGSLGTRTRYGASRILRKVTVWRAGGSGSSAAVMPNSDRRWAASFSGAGASDCSAGDCMADCTAGKCHRFENNALWPLFWRSSKVRPRGSSKTAAERARRTGFGLRRGEGKRSAMPRACARHQRETGHASHRGARGVQTVAPSSIMAWFQSPGVALGGPALVAASGVRRKQCVRCRAERAPAARPAQIAANRAQARQHARDIAVEDRVRRAVGDAEHGSGGVAADAGQGQRVFQESREFAAVAGHDLLCRAVQIARAAVIAEAGPMAQNRVGARAGKIADCGEALEESPVVGNHRGNARLLQHDLGDPHAVRVARRAPVQIALGFGEPAEQLRVESRADRLRRRCRSCEARGRERAQAWRHCRAIMGARQAQRGKPQVSRTNRGRPELQGSGRADT